MAAVLALLSPSAAGITVGVDLGLEDERCAVTPGGWGAPPNGGNEGQLLHDHFDDVFGDRLTVGNLVFLDAQAVTNALPYTGPETAFKNHAVALEINIAFGDAGLLNGTISDVTAVSTNLTLHGKTAVEILEMAEAIMLADSTLTGREYSDLIDVMTGFNEETFGCHDKPDCPAGVIATAENEGVIELTWTPVVGAEHYIVYRAVGDGPFLVLDDEVEGTTYTDSSTAVGQTYSYKVTAWDGALESEGCRAVTTTAVPFFGGALVTALAGIGAVGAYLGFRRRS